MPWPAMWFLHTGLRHVSGRAAAKASSTNDRAARGEHHRQPLQVHGLRVDPACRPPRSRALETVTTRWFGARVQRVEDDRLLRGHGRFTDDIGEGALECCFVRSPYAHARIR